MSDLYWDSVKEYIGSQSLRLGPQFSYQALHTPRHLSFVFSRYKFAAKMLSNIQNARVLEMGCGEGIGSLVLLEEAESVTGLDFDPDAIAYARENLSSQKHLNLEFISGDITHMQLSPFDAVVSLDVIEHVPTKEEDLFIQNIANNLKEDGICIIGTPNITAQAYASEMSRRGHINLFDANRLRNTFQKYFHHVFSFGMNDEVLHTGFSAMCHYLFILCCHKRKL